MKAVIEYTVITELGEKSFIKLINDAIENGWQPIGGVSVRDVQTFSQAMVKYKQPKQDTPRGEVLR